MNAPNAPLSPDEARLAAILQEILEIPAIGRHDRYLDLGGNSVSLYLVIERIQAETGVELDPQMFFDPERSSLAGLAQEIARAAALTSSNATAGA